MTREEKKRLRMQIMRLLDAGIREHDGKHVSELDYYTLRHVLAMQKLKD